ncbi:hypothetical protein JTB14_005385 [Gonioctena quinquepunctata]|nr:hypothetical protein JTB14_005385 [Gonioctena quinquepunctata]
MSIQFLGSELLRNSGTFPERYVLDAFVHYRTVTRKDLFKGSGGILTLQGEEWFKVRSMVNPILMQPRTVNQYVAKMDEIARELVENMKYFSKLSQDNQMPENFMNELYKWSLESIGMVALNKHFGCLDLNAPEDSEPRKLVEAVLTMFDHLYYLEISPPLWKFISMPLFNKFVKNMDFITRSVPMVDIAEVSVEKSSEWTEIIPDEWYLKMVIKVIPSCLLPLNHGMPRYIRGNIANNHSEVKPTGAEATEGLVFVKVLEDF